MTSRSFAASAYFSHTSLQKAEYLGNANVIVFQVWNLWLAPWSPLHVAHLPRDERRVDHNAIKSAMQGFRDCIWMVEIIFEIVRVLAPLVIKVKDPAFRPNG